MKDTEKVTPYTEKGEIDKVINILKNYSFDELIKIKYYKDSLDEKNTDESQLRNIYPEFERIKLILYRERDNKKNNYDIFYELDDGQSVLLALDIEKTPPLLVNGYPCYKNLKKFIQQILKKYRKNMI